MLKEVASGSRLPDHNSPNFAGARDLVALSTHGGTSSLGNSQALTGIGSFSNTGMMNFGKQMTTIQKRGFSDRYSSQASGVQLNSRTDEDGIDESEQISSEDSEERDPKKLYTPVTTILMSFEVKKKQEKRDASEDDPKLMTIIESEELSHD